MTRKNPVKVPWDSKALATDAYEIRHVSEKVMKKIMDTPGHYAVKVDPLSSKKILHKYGFYYCDTLIEPYCRKGDFRYFRHTLAGITRDFSLGSLIKISHGAFSHGRFHRDFNIDRKIADLRYDRWLMDLYRSKNVLGLVFGGLLAGFIGFSGTRLVLHAVSEKYKGKGLAKYLWSPACKALFDAGRKELTSSISASNMAAINLYASLGFKFRNPLDVYHRVIAKTER